MPVWNSFDLLSDFDACVVTEIKEPQKLIDYIDTQVAPEILLSSLKQQENSIGIHELPSKQFSPGDKLLIVEGSFEGYEATLFSQNSDDRVIVLLKVAENFVKVKLEQSLVEPLS